jgi:hypothetical protein
MELLLGSGERLAVAQCGPDFVILEAPAERPAGAAEVVVRVDGEVWRYPCFLEEGIRGMRVAVARLPGRAAA